MKRSVLLVFLLAACGPAPGYTADGQFVADPNAALASPRRAYPATPANNAPQGSGGQQVMGPPTQPGQPPQGDPSYQSQGAAPAQTAPVQPCDDSCRFGNNGECDDGRQGSDTDVCAAGTDCTDCGH